MMVGRDWNAREGVLIGILGQDLKAFGAKSNLLKLMDVETLKKYDVVRIKGTYERVV